MSRHPEQGRENRSKLGGQGQLVDWLQRLPSFLLELRGQLGKKGLERRLLKPVSAKRATSSLAKGRITTPAVSILG